MKKSIFKDNQAFSSSLCIPWKNGKEPPLIWVYIFFRLVECSSLHDSYGTLDDLTNEAHTDLCISSKRVGPSAYTEI